MTPDEGHLYRAAAELAYAVAKADYVVEEKERNMFLKIVKQEFNLNDWVAELRFETIASSVLPGSEQAYAHAMMLIEKGKIALNEEIIEKLKNIIRKVAEVSGVSLEEQDFIERFHVDIHKIYSEVKKV